MADLTIPRGDKGYTLTFTVNDSAGSAFNLTGYTVTLKVWRSGRSDRVLVNSACTITDAANGTCTYTLAAGDVPVAEQLDFVLVLTKSGVEEKTETYTLDVTEAP
jgi:hypothetical protein